MNRKKFPQSIISSVFAALALGAICFAPATAMAQKEFTAEQIVESLIVISGTRPGLAQVRKTRPGEWAPVADDAGRPS